MNRYSRGWTLPELLIALAIAALLTMLAQQQYESQQLRCQRGLATRSLLQLGLRQEDYRLRHGRYADSFAALIQIDAGLLYVRSDGTLTATAASNYLYQLRFDTGSSGDYWQLQASSIGPQTADSGCQTWTLDARGRRNATGNSTNPLRDCWP